MSEKDKFKFSSSFLKKPFLLNNNTVKSELEKEELTPNKQEIIEDIENENTSKISSKINNHDVTYSISELHRPQTSLFNNNENTSSKLPNNLSISTSSMNSKKRKPFGNLTFYSEKKNILNNDMNELNELIDKNREEKDNESIMTDIQFKNIDVLNNNPLKESQTEFNSSQISQNEKSMIISSYKLISKETIEKAKKLNKQYKETPFWIKFFEEIENDSLKNNSSYFKINNKNEYIKNLVNMIQRDADLYDKLQKSKEIKQETENEIKKLIQENNNDINDNNNINITNTENNKNNLNNINNNNTSKIKRYNSSNFMNKNKSNNNIDNNSNNNTNINNNININNTEKKNDKNDISDKFTKILESYNKLDEKERKLFFNEEDYESFKFKLITGGKFNSEKEKEIEKIPATIKKLENLEDIDEKPEKPMTENEKKKDEILKMKGIKEFKTIDMLYFGDNYTFEELNYNKIDFYIFNKESLPRILALDRRLHEIDPERYKTSINTDLKKLQDEFNAGKEERMKKADKEIRDMFNKYMEDTKETKKTIFDIKPKDDTRIKYKDYLHYNDDIKKERKELKSKLNKLDEKIKLIHSNSNKELTKEQISKFSQELEQYHSSEEFKQKYDSMHVPGLSLINRLQKEMKEFEINNKELEQGLIETQKLIEEQEKKSSKEEKEKYYKEFVQPFLEHEKEVNAFEQENIKDNDKLKQLEEEMKKEEELLNNIQNNLNELNQNKNKYEEMFEEADKIILENNNEINNENNNDIDYIKQYEVEKIVDEQKQNEKLMEELDNQILSFEEKLQNIKKSNDAFEKESKEKKIMTPEEFCKEPDYLIKLLQEIEEDKKNEEENEKNNKENDEQFEEDSLEEKNKEENNDEDININKETEEFSNNQKEEIKENKEDISDLNDINNNVDNQSNEINIDKNE